MIRQALHILLAAVGDQRVKSLIKKHPELAEDIQTLADEDPTNGKQTYLQWAVNKLKAGEDLEDIMEAVEYFHDTKKLLEIKDINKYKAPKDVMDEVEKVWEAEDQAKKLKPVYNKGGLVVHQIFTKTQMCETGEGSEWCTAHVGGTYWDDEYTNVPGWEFYVLEKGGKKYLAYLVNGELRELNDWFNARAPDATHYLYEAGILKSSPREDWPQWLQAAETKDAVVDIVDGEVIWKSGTWIAGGWGGGVWKTGVWENGDWFDGVWEDGTWKGGVWKTGVWESGYWRGGTWKNGIWKNGRWHRGTWEKGTRKGGAWEDGVWEDGVWEFGTWEKGVWRNGTWKKGSWWAGTWEDGVWEKGYWSDGVWKKGTWRGGEWEDGDWWDGVWEDGVWKTGTWHSGTWQASTWENGTWKNGLWQGGSWYDGTWEDGVWEYGYWQGGSWHNGTWEDGLQYINGEWKRVRDFPRKFARASLTSRVLNNLRIPR